MPFLAKTQEKTGTALSQDSPRNGRGDRSHNTIKRQDTLWRTYLKADFGKKRFNGISLGEIQDYLANKYYVEG